MNYEKISFKVSKSKQRAHKALFDNDLLFGHKVINPKNNYKRKPKHSNAFWNESY
jgi:hypothetical protein